MFRNILSVCFSVFFLSISPACGNDSKNNDGDTASSIPCTDKSDCPDGYTCGTSGFCESEDAGDTGFPDGGDSGNTGDSADTSNTADTADPVWEKGDADDDGILNGDEGKDDTDGDGTPDYQDTDSDGDGIPDETEAPNGAPVDTDNDEAPDFKDTDSDGDGMPDNKEGMDDPDNDGIPSYRDTDSDNDKIDDVIEFGGDPENPADFDGDGIPDYKDPDSDDDGVQDRYEGVKDTDKDNIPNFHDLDSDGDGYSDTEERGSEEEPRDSDNDGIYNFLDTDSDNDGLGDAQEPDCSSTLGKHGMNWDDVDGDGFSDLAEVAVGSDPCSPIEGVTDIVEFYFELPHGDPEKTDILEFTPTVKKADVFFNVDTTGSMGGEINTLKATLSNTIIEQTRQKISDSAFGLSQFRDENEVGLFLIQTPTTDKNAAQNAVNSLGASGGGDCAEAGYWSLYRVSEETAWRSGTIPIMLHMTDASTHSRGGVDRNKAVESLNRNGIKVITVLSTGGCEYTTADSQLNDLSNATGAVVPACAGAGRTVLKYGIDGSGSGLDTAVVNGIDALVKYSQFDIYTEPADDGDPATIDTTCFLKKVEALAMERAPGDTCAPLAQPAEFNSVGYNNGFTGFSTGTSAASATGAKLTFTVHAQNDTCYEPGSEAKSFTTIIRVIGVDTGSILDEQTVTIIVPPELEGEED